MRMYTFVCAHAGVHVCKCEHYNVHMYGTAHVYTYLLVTAGSYDTRAERCHLQPPSPVRWLRLIPLAF